MFMVLLLKGITINRALLTLKLPKLITNIILSNPKQIPNLHHIRETLVILLSEHQQEPMIMSKINANQHIITLSPPQSIMD